MASRKRFFTRHPIVVGVRVRVPDGWARMVTVDVSRRGLFLRTEDPIAIGRIAQMEIELPSGQTLEAMGHVRRSLRERDESGIGPGMGIEFFVMSKDAQDGWDRFVIDQKRLGAARLEESDDLPLQPRGVPSEPPENLIRLTGLPPDQDAGSSQPFFLAGDDDDSDDPTAGLELDITQDDASIPLPPAGDSGESEQPDDAADAADEKAENATLLKELPTDTASGRPPSIFAAKATQRFEARELDDARATISGEVELSDDVRELIEAARDDAAETEAAKVAYITVQPSSQVRLAEFVERKYRGSNVFLRTEVACHEGQVVEVTLVHPDTDAEFVIVGEVKRVLETGSTPGVLLRFSRPEPDERAQLQHFVVTGDPAIVSAPIQSEDLERFQQLADAAPTDLDAQLELAWAHLRLAEDAESAILAFLTALTLDGGNLEVHQGLAIAYGLAGDVMKSYAFIRSAYDLTRG